MKGTVFQPRVLQLNLDNINRLPHSKYPDRKNRGICRGGNRTKSNQLYFNIKHITKLHQEGNKVTSRRKQNDIEDIIKRPKRPEVMMP